MHPGSCLFPSIYTHLHIYIYIYMNICLYIQRTMFLLCRGRINVTILCKGWVLHSRRKREAAANDVYVSLIFTLLCVILGEFIRITTSHWYPSKLTHFTKYFGEDSSSYPRHNTLVKCVNLQGFQLLA